jgi:hypothetical protein
MRVILGCFFLGLATTASSKPILLEHIPLQWQPTSSLQLGTAQMTSSSVQVDTFNDARADKKTIGENREEDTPRPVTTTDDVGAFVSTHVRQLFDQAGIKTVDSGSAVVLKGEVTKFFVRETSVYKSEVEIHFMLSDPAGTELFKGFASGEATRFGRSYRAENYYEVLSDAVVNAVSSMLQSPSVQKALGGPGAGAP